MKIQKSRLATIMILIVITVILCIIAGKLETQEEKEEESSVYARAVVTEMITDDTEPDEKTENMLRGSQNVIVKILSGEYKDKEYLTTNYISVLYHTNAQIGTHVIVRLDKTEDKVTAFIYCYDRIGWIIGIVAVFAAALTLIGKKKGFAALISLLYSIFLIFRVMFPFVLHGANVLITAIGLLVMMTVMTFVLIEEINQKTISATLGTMAGVMIAGLFAAIAGLGLHISGFNTTEAEELLLLGTDHGMKLKNLFTAGILFAALGAVMDVAMSIASAIHEMKQIDQTLSFKQLFTSGMNIGRDAMGTMANTLILAFVGSSFTLLLLLYTYDLPLLQVINTDLIGRELIQGVAGSIGIIMTVPLVAAISSCIESSTPISK